MTWPLTGPLYGSVWPTCGPQATIWFNRTLKLMNETQRGWGERAADWSQPTVSFHNSQHAPLPSSLLRAAPGTTLLPLWWRHVRLGPWKDHWPGLCSEERKPGNVSGDFFPLLSRLMKRPCVLGLQTTSPHCHLTESVTLTNRLRHWCPLSVTQFNHIVLKWSPRSS